MRGVPAPLRRYGRHEGRRRWRHASRRVAFRPPEGSWTTKRDSNGLVEATTTNAKIRPIHRRAFGFRSPHAPNSLAMLDLGGYRPQLPWL